MEIKEKTGGKLIRPIAYVRTDFKEKFGIPRQSGRVPSLKGEVVFLPEYRSDDALRGIEQFSRLWLVFDFSAARRDGFAPTVRPPRKGGNERVGVFASRSPFRPNGLGLSSVKLEKTEKRADEGTVLIVSGVDLLDGTPVYDVKPYIPYTDSHPEAKGGYADEYDKYRLKVNFPPELLSMLTEDKREALIGCLADDPRPAYHDDGREYGMSFAGFSVRFVVCDGSLTVIDVKREDR